MLIDPNTIPPSYWLNTLFGWWDSTKIYQSLFQATFQDLYSTAQISGTCGVTWSQTDTKNFGPQELYNKIDIFNQVPYLKRYFFTGPNVLGSPVMWGGPGSSPSTCHYVPTGPIIGFKTYLDPSGYYCGADYAYNTCACTSQLFMLTDNSLKTINWQIGDPPVNLAWTISNSLAGTGFLNNCGDLLLSPVTTTVNGYSPVTPVTAGFITSTTGNAQSITLTVTDLTISGTFNVLLQVTNPSGYTIGSDLTVYKATPLYFYVKLVILCIPSYTLATQPETPFDYTVDPVSSTATTPTAISFYDSFGCNIPITYSCQYSSVACPSWIAINASNQMTVNTNSPANIGYKSVTINGTYGPLANGITYSVPSTSWVLRVNQCIPSFTLITQPEGIIGNPFTFTIYQDTSITTGTAILFTDSVGCGIVPTFSCQYSGGACPSYIGLTGSNKMNVNLPAPVNAGNYIITINGQYVSQQGATVALPDTLWYLEIIDPCATTSFVQVKLPEYKTIVGLISQISYQEFLNNYGTICGSQTATVTPLDIWQSWTTTGIHSATDLKYILGIDASGQTLGQILTKTILVQLVNYPLVQATFVQQIVMYSVSLSQIYDQTYTTNNPLLSIPFEVKWMPETPEMSDSNYFLNFSGLEKSYNRQILSNQTLPNSPEFYILVQNTLVKIENTAARNAGEYKIEYSVQFKAYPAISQIDRTFNLVILRPPNVTTVNILPTFVSPNDWPTQVTLGCGQAWVQKVPECEDANNDICTEYIDLGTANIFAKKDLVLKLIYVEKDVLNKNLEGVYPVKVIISDGYGQAINILQITVVCNFIVQAVKNLADNQLVRQGSIIPSISQINNIGQVQISFSEPMEPVNINNITNGTFQQNNLILPTLAITMVPYDLQKSIDFSWVCTNYTSTSLDLQLNFTRPGRVSYSSPRDQIQITFWGQNYFIAQSNSTALNSTQLRRLNTSQYVEFGFNLTHDVPQQIQVQMGQQIAEVGKLIQNSGKAFEIGAFILNLLMAGSLQHLLCQIKKIQIIVHQILVNLSIPASAQIYFGFLLPIVAFSIIPTDDFYDQLLDLPQPAALTQNFQALGYESKYLLRNLGSIGIYFAFYPAIILTSFTIGKLCKCKKAQQASKRLNSMLYWNGWFALVEDSYLILTVSIMLNLRLYSPDDFQFYGRTINFLTAAISAPAVLIHVGLVVFILIRKFDLIRRRHPSTDKFKYLFYDLKIRANHLNLTTNLSGKHTITHPIWSFIRRLILGVTVVCMTDQPLFCLFIMNFTTLTSIIIVGTQEPFAEKVKKSLDLFNEFIVLVINYHLLCFTDFLSDPDMREYVGYSMIVVTSVFLAINIGFALVRMGQKPCTRLRQTYLRMKAMKKRNENKKKKVTEPVVGEQKWILMEKLGLVTSWQDMYAKARLIGSRLTFNHQQDPVTQAETQAVEVNKNDLQSLQLEDQEGPNLQFELTPVTGQYQFNHVNGKRSEYFVEPPTTKQIRSQYFAQPLVIKEDRNKDLIAAKTQKLNLTQYLSRVVGVVPNEEVSNQKFSFQIEDVADLERKQGRSLTEHKPHYLPEGNIFPERSRARLMQLNKEYLMTKKF